MVLVDTSVIIDFLNRRSYEDLITRLLSGNEFVTTEIVIMEVLQGIKDEKFYETTKRFLTSLPLVSIRYKDYLKAVEIYRGCRQKGITIRKSIDCIIAAVALNNNLQLLSNDRDFEHIREHFQLNMI